MLVTFDSFNEVMKILRDENYISLDTETTGLRSYLGDRLFSIIIATGKETYYFNYNMNHPEYLPKDTINSINELFLNTCRTVFFANAKFDMRMLAQEVTPNFQADIHDVLVADRILENDQPKINLNSVALKHGFTKSEAVEEYIKEHNLWSWVDIPGKKKRSKNKYYHKVPLEIIQPYAEQDARITYEIGMRQIAQLEAQELSKVFLTEKKISKVCFKMEHVGLKVNVPTCKVLAAEETLKYEQAARTFYDLTGTVLIDSAKVIGPIFNRMGYVLPKTEAGQDSVSDSFLSKNNTRISKAIQTYREHYKIANTYYRSFTWFADKDGVIHADSKQSGTRTGRFSYADPNLQNIPDSPVRRVIIPRPSYFLTSLDYDQQEYKMMLDYADERPIIEAVKAGKDLHQATADAMGTDRTQAKTLNFMLLYGGGVVKLALALFPVTADESQLWKMWKLENGWEMDEDTARAEITDALVAENMPLLYKAKRLRELYFEKLPGVQEFVDTVKSSIKTRDRKEKGYVRTWTGRKLYLPRHLAYKGPNAIIQGGASDVAKLAMIAIDKHLENRKSRMLLQVHDQIDFEIHKDEVFLIQEIKEIMESIYKGKLKLTCSVSHSFTNWYDMREGIPSEQEARDQVQGESACKT